MKVFYSDTFELPLPVGHRFPAGKYRMLRERLAACTFCNLLEFQLAPAATDKQILTVHTAEYLQKLVDGTLSKLEQRRIGFPWSPELVERSRRSTGATLGAARAALREGRAVHLAGGTHHAFPDHGQGFCVFNDVAVAIRSLQSDHAIRRAVVLDLDVHQGNGTAAIFAEDDDVFTLSIHGARNFPFKKTESDLDVGLPDNTDDASYLAALEEALKRAPISEADIVFYLAGADPYRHDRFGKLGLSKHGLAERDQIVLEMCHQLQKPVAIVMAGGYADQLNDIVEIHAMTVQKATGGDGRRRKATEGDGR